jgi:hypothetical protein
MYHENEQLPLACMIRADGSSQPNFALALER